MRKIVLVSGGFDPLHSGHINLFSAARKLGDSLIVAVNSDQWLQRKKGKSFMPLSERINIAQNLKMVDLAFEFDDSDGSARDAISVALSWYPDCELIFANGGDRTEGNIPEMDNTDERVTFEFGVGGSDKANSSSWILSEWKSPKTIRPWGYYRNLHQDGPGTKVKELTVKPNARLSMQRHFHRSEHWICTYGKATVILGENNESVVLQKHDQLHIPVGTWHQLSNLTDQDLRIVEIQYGNNCIEEDIERIGVSTGYGASLYDS
jgi:cytidyltransferase-like protein